MLFVDILFNRLLREKSSCFVLARALLHSKIFVAVIQ